MIVLYGFVILDLLALAGLGLCSVRLLRTAHERAEREHASLASVDAPPTAVRFSTPVYRRAPGPLHDFPVDYRTGPLPVTQIPIVRTRPDPVPMIAGEPMPEIDLPDEVSDPIAPVVSSLSEAPVEPQEVTLLEAGSGPQPSWNEAFLADPIDGVPFQDGEAVVACACGACYRTDTAQWLREAAGGTCLHCKRELSLQSSAYAAIRESVLIA